VRRRNSVDWWVFDFVDTLLVASPWQAASAQTVYYLFLEMLKFSNFYFFLQKKFVFFLGEGKKMKNLLEYFQSSKLIN
jgi:hypothetical protein